MFRTVVAPSPWHMLLRSITRVLGSRGIHRWMCPCACGSLAPGVLDRRWFTAGIPTLSRSVNPAWPALDPSFFTRPRFELKTYKHRQLVNQAMQHHCLQQLRHVATQRSAGRFSTSAYLRRAFKEGDTVLLRDKASTQDGNLLKLQAAKTTHTHRGVIEHANIIGKEPRQIVRSSKGFEYRVHEPTLAEYVRLTPRLVTPVRPMPSEHASSCSV